MSLSENSEIVPECPPRSVNAIRRTKIIATLGPATESPEMIRRLIDAGMNVARINMSHATPESTRALVSRIREAAVERGKLVGILMDLQGPAIRTGDLPTQLNLKPGERIALTVRGEKSEEQYSVDVNYDQLVDDIRVGDIVVVDNGMIQLKVLEKRRNQLTCEVLTEGVLGSRRHINLPGVRVNLPALTDKDIRDVELGIELGVDFIAMSFCREAADVMRLKAILDYRKAPQRVIAKLEDQEGVRNVNAIIDAADGVMVARGDLGMECPYEELPIIQRRVVKQCIIRGKPVIVATHMLESMIENPSPTRAEITDVSNAVYEQADAIMLSGETSVGRYPVKCIEVMDRIARRVERSGGANYAEAARMDSLGAKMVKSAFVLSKEVNAEALIVFTRRGSMARNASWLRPLHSPLYAFTDSKILLNQLTLHWGLTPFYMEFGENPESNFAKAVQALRDHGLVRSGSRVVAVTEVDVGGKLIDTILMETVE
ncbi:MAG: pyruvate kinase [Kiritimatiellae bacterium]|nr:pyruvate kinase [Kiritimatiellia bacterium]MDW8458175.1 pyruvate kinase [Verrucomicrobiota bacterium]